MSGRRSVAIKCFWPQDARVFGAARCDCTDEEKDRRKSRVCLMQTFVILPFEGGTMEDGEVEVVVEEK